MYKAPSFGLGMKKDLRESIESVYGINNTINEEEQLIISLFEEFLEENFHVEMLTEEDLDYVFENEFPQWLEEGWGKAIGKGIGYIKKLLNPKTKPAGTEPAGSEPAWSIKEVLRNADAAEKAAKEAAKEAAKKTANEVKTPPPLPKTPPRVPRTTPPPLPNTPPRVPRTTPPPLPNTLQKKINENTTINRLGDFATMPPHFSPIPTQNRTQNPALKVRSSDAPQSGTSGRTTRIQTTPLKGYAQYKQKRGIKSYKKNPEVYLDYLKTKRKPDDWKKTVFEPSNN